ncbi:neutral/alkaline non-lysosomal ceramidase N-terminal domain-containing protein [Sandaracinus amylolyticus]|uniref:neutral/alkaline non-lysosomal ceramidase N-terminal domain-containing protein n=1 Tax=Sandaracinus amylolyticus TaxID=927083 RepID=UPI001F3DEE0C|nr:neutral/alkaline non-lysosomal ceramidase N-terminal domain-containing protein [Sandaracinus amylolyticus]UJR80779.1 Neutral ceramidase [Sandaracinus amylolyticus]
MPYRSIARWALSLVVVSTFALGCGDDDAAVDPDAGPVDGGPPAPPPSTNHCTYVEMAPTARAGGTVTAGTLSAGAAERPISIPLGVTLGAYTARSSRFGSQGFVDTRESALAGSFASSVGIETWPHVRVVAITSGTYDEASPAGDETILIVKAELGVAYQGLTHELEARLGPAFSGKVLFAVSHSHSAFANYTGHSAMQVGFGAFHRTAYDALLGDMEAAAREALANRRPARVGIAHETGFDPEDRVNRDRRGENDDLAGGRRDDHDLFVIRVDETDGTAIAVLPVFGMHGTVLDADNPMVSGDAPGAIERVLEDAFEDRVVVIHLQGAAGDVSPVGLEGATQCDLGAACTSDDECEGLETCADGHCRGPLCRDYARVESVGWNARAAILAAWTSAGESMRESAELEMVSRSVTRGPGHERFTVRDGALAYAEFDLRREADGRIWEDPETRTELVSPIDEFNAPYGAALCSGDLVLGRAQMPGTSDLDDTPYPSCLMLQEVDRLFETALEVTLDAPPICDTTRTTVSAARIGEFVLVTLPGEPVTLLVDRLRALSSVDADHTIVIGYAQDHGGYMMTAEDWLRGGYEPTITFWGPLEGEAIMEEAARLIPLAMSSEREDAAEGGTTRVQVPVMDDALEPDAAPMAGMVPSSLPSTVLTRRGRPIAAQPIEVARLESAYFVWIGADPLAGSPVVTIERETSPGTWESATRRSGRAVGEGDVLLTWTPDPLSGEGPHTHYWAAEWQAVGWLDDAEGAYPLAPRRGAPVGIYRFRVVGPGYEITSETFRVSPATLSVVVSGTSIEVSASAPFGYRLLDLETGATRPAPLRGATIEVSFDGGAATEITLDATGRGTIAPPAGWGFLSVTDEHGNTGSATP